MLNNCCAKDPYERPRFFDLKSSLLEPFSSDPERVSNKQYSDGHFTGITKGGQRYEGTLCYYIDDEYERKEYTGSFENGE